MQAAELVTAKAANVQFTNISSTNGSDSNASSLTKGGSVATVAKVAYLVALSIFIILGNILVIISVVKVKVMHRVTNYLLVSLATADLMVGVFTVPFFILWLLQRDIFMQAGLCNVVLLTCLFVSVASQLNVLVVTAERYAAVCHPFLHRCLLLSKPELVRWVVSAVWFSSAASTGLSSLAVAPDPSRCSYHSHFRSSFLLATVVLGVVVPFATISALNLRMLVKVRLSRLFGEEMGRPATKAETGPRCRWHHRSAGKLSKASAMVVVVCSLFLLAWTPFLAMVVVYALCPACPLHQALDLILLFTFGSSACNPVVYAHCNRTFRHAYKQILAGCCLPSSEAVPVLARKGSVFLPVGGHLPTVAVNG